MKIHFIEVPTSLPFSVIHPTNYVSLRSFCDLKKFSTMKLPYAVVILIARKVPASRTGLIFLRRTHITDVCVIDLP